ncbi:TPA: hypothetical protein ACGPBJ_000578 [Streptococcus suis]
MATFGDIKSATLPEGGNLILMQADTFAQRVPFHTLRKSNSNVVDLI